jgi:hypothetical protein
LQETSQLAGTHLLAVFTGCNDMGVIAGTSDSPGVSRSLQEPDDNQGLVLAQYSPVRWLNAMHQILSNCIGKSACYFVRQVTFVGCGNLRPASNLADHQLMGTLCEVLLINIFWCV